MDKFKVNIKKLHPNAVIPFQTYDSDYCFDCVATSCVEVAPNVYKYGLGFALQLAEELPKGWKACFNGRARSSIHNTGMILSNGEGTLDLGYTGEIFMVFYHVMPTLPRYQVGDKICQIHLELTHDIEFVEVDELKATERADGGYGSTGK